MKRSKILIYRDYGCASLGPLIKSLSGYFNYYNYDLDFTDAKSIINDNSLDGSVVAFFMPGGAGIPYEMKLKGPGNDNIRSFVSKGGIYCGICAGAYYACINTLFETDIPELCIKSKSCLNLIDCDAVGTLHKEFNIKPYSSNIESATLAKLRYFDNDIHYSYYSGGPYFDGIKNKNINVLANYEFEKYQNLPAIIQSNYGKGSVVLSGVHYEYKSSDIVHSVFKSHPDFNAYKKLSDKLDLVENYRLSLFNKVMSKIVERSR